MGKMMLALSSYNVPLPFEETISLLAQHSVSWVELWTSSIIGGFRDHRCDDDEMARMKTILDRYGVKVACVNSGSVFSKGMVGSPTRYVNAVRAVLTVADELNARFVNCYVHRFARGYADIDSYVRIVQPVAHHAEDMGVTLVVENEPYDASATPKGMLRIIAAVDSPFFQINFDPTNFYQGNIEAYPYAYELLKDHIAYIHLKNGCRYIPEIHRELGKGGPFAPPNESDSIFYPTIQYGAVNIEGLLDRLKQDGYQGFCTLEPHVPLDALSEYHRIEVAYMLAKGIR